MYIGIVTVFSVILTEGVAVDKGYFWHVTDFHWDFTYWTDQLSCGGAHIQNPGEFGNEWCDAPWKLIEKSIEGMNRTDRNVDFILWTGDTAPHVDKSNLSTKINEELVRNVTRVMKNNFPDKPVYATFGNHDYYPRDMFPPHGNEIYNDTYRIWKEWINDDSQTTNFLKGGYYTVLIRPKLRLIALNTNMYYTKATASNTQSDPADQLAWMEGILNNASENGEKVMLTGHVPPGYTTPRKVRWMTAMHNKKFVDIIIRHSGVIAGMFFGHEHHDSFRLFYDTSGQAVASIFLAPSVTPWRYQIESGNETPHNPGVRLVEYDRDTGNLLDFVQYFVILDDINQKHELEWLIGYTFKEMYGVSDMGPLSLDTLVNQMNGPEDHNFQKFVLWYNTNVNTSVEYPCNMDCYRSIICGFQHMTEEPFMNCVSGTDTNGTNMLHQKWSWSRFVIFQCFMTLLLVLFCRASV